MNYGAIKNCDIANGLGCRVSLFVSGCTNHCPGCFQPETWDFSYGKEFTSAEEDLILQLLVPAYIRGLTLLGGDPFEPRNQSSVHHLVKRVRAELPEKTIWAYSGFTYEMLTTSGAYPHTDVTDDLLAGIDVLVDGPFVEAKKDLSLRFRGSANQRVLDLKLTREKNAPVLLQF